MNCLVGFELLFEMSDLLGGVDSLGWGLGPSKPT